jgi:alpha-L-fucosidase 2
MPSCLQQRLPFPFPARDPHAGIPLGNGVFGALLWGEGRRVRVTVNRADYWDHRGGVPAHPEATYSNLRAWLEAGDESRLNAVFGGQVERPAGEPPKPTRLPMGRVDLELPVDWTAAAGGLHLLTGEAEVELAGRGGAMLRASVLRETPVLCLRVTGVPGGEIRTLGCPPDSAEVRAHFRQYGFPAPQPFDLGPFAGWVQEGPGEPALCVAWMRHDSPSGLLLFVAAVFGENPGEARKNALQELEGANALGYTPATVRAFGWWRRWWEHGARVETPEATADLLYHLGMYKLGGLSAPGGPAATLQGPWVEDHRLPPWSGDYHFNVNVQECYWPAFAGNHLEALDPLIGMLQGWAPRLREYAAAFVGVSDGLRLPHAVDDRGTAVGGFWPGFVDQGAMGWTAHLLWQRYLFSGDAAYLSEVAYPFLRGALRVYEAMLEEDGSALCLPVGVSPEYGGASLGAWGRNATFQLAVVHALCRALRSAARTLGRDDGDVPRWEEIERRLPLAAVGEGPELLLWEGQPLAESHRHHSHLAGLYPFDLFDLHSEPHRLLVRNSFRRWTQQGMGQWTGWCFPWAAILHARLGEAEAASLMLETFRRAFMGPGYATTHDAVFPGLTLFDSRPHIMQVEASQGAAAAVLEMLAHTSGGVLRVFPAAPAGFGDCSFAGVRAEGAFLVSAAREGGRVRRVEVRSEVGGPLRLVNPWGDGPVQVLRDERRSFQRGRVLEVETGAGETVVLEQRAVV